jgi:hypothetical protein
VSERVRDVRVAQDVQRAHREPGRLPELPEQDGQLPRVDLPAELVGEDEVVVDVGGAGERLRASRGRCRCGRRRPSMRRT